MAREITFKIGDDKIMAGITKVDRNKVYGRTEIKYIDYEGNNCQFISMLDDGKTMISTGGLSFKTIDTNGNEVSRNELKAVTINDKAAQLYSSIFDEEIVFDLSKNLDDYYLMDVKSIYQLSINETDSDSLKKELDKRKVLYFKFNYRAGYNQDDAFLLSKDNIFFVAVGQIQNFEYAELEKLPELNEEDDVEILDDDFGFDSL